MTVSDYSSMEKALADAPAPKILPAGVEVKARIVRVRTGVSEKNEATWYSPVFDIPDDPMVIEFNDFFWDLGCEDKVDPKQVARNRYNFSTFVQAFKIDISKPFSWEDDLPGKIGWLIPGVRKDEKYGDQNTVSKYVTGKKGKGAKASNSSAPY